MIKLYEVRWINPRVLYQSTWYIELIFAHKDEAKQIYLNYYQSMSIFCKIENIIIVKEIPINSGVLSGNDLIPINFEKDVIK